MACEGLLRDLDAIMSDVRRPGDIAALVNEVVGAMERAAVILQALRYTCRYELAGSC